MTDRERGMRERMTDRERDEREKGSGRVIQLPLATLHEAP